jgi:hypothetical protein
MPRPEYRKQVAEKERVTHPLHSLSFDNQAVVI